MSDYLRLLVIFLAVINPAAAAVGLSEFRGKNRRDRQTLVWLAAAIAAGVLVVAAAVSDEVLDFLDIAPETFRIAAGIVMMTAGVYVVWTGRTGTVSADETGWQAAISPAGLPIIAGPAAVIAAMSYGADEGVGKAIGALLPVVGVAAIVALPALGKYRTSADTVGRFLGALLVAIAAGLIVSGVRDI